MNFNNLRVSAVPLRDADLFGGQKNTDIESLRGIAIVFVMLDHGLAFWPNPAVQRLTSDFVSFWGGVDIFFAISGYVIMASILRSMPAVDGPAARAAQFGGFWIKRVWRLWPSAWLWLLVPAALALGLDVLSGTGLSGARGVAASVLSGVLNLVNFQQWAANSGHGIPAQLSSQYWSLALEEQFYLAISLAVLASPSRHVARNIAIVAAGLILLQFPLKRPANSSDLFWFIRSDALAWGVLIALLARTEVYRYLEPTFLHRKRYALPFLLVMVMGIAATQMMYFIDFYVGLIAMMSGALVFVASFNKSYLGIAGRTLTILNYIGDRSYSLYLISGPAQQFLAHLIAPSMSVRRNILLNMLIILVSIGLAELNFRVVEAPLRLRGRASAQFYQQRMSVGLHSIGIR